MVKERLIKSNKNVLHLTNYLVNKKGILNNTLINSRNKLCKSKDIINKTWRNNYKQFYNSSESNIMKINLDITLVELLVHCEGGLIFTSEIQK